MWEVLVLGENFDGQEMSPERAEVEVVENEGESLTDALVPRGIDAPILCHTRLLGFVLSGGILVLEHGDSDEWALSDLAHLRFRVFNVSRVMDSYVNASRALHDVVL